MEIFQRQLPLFFFLPRVDVGITVRVGSPRLSSLPEHAQRVPAGDENYRAKFAEGPLN